MTKQRLFNFAIIISLSVFGTSSLLQAAVITFTDGTGNHLWNNTSNWDLRIPLAADDPSIDGAKHCIISTGTSAVGNLLTVCKTSGTSQLDIDEGSLTINDLTVGLGIQSTGILSLKNGSLTCYGASFIGSEGEGIMNISGGTWAYFGMVGIGTSGPGTLNISNGSVIGDMGDLYIGGEFSAGTLNMTGGNITVYGAKTSIGGTIGISRLSMQGGQADLREIDVGYWNQSEGVIDMNGTGRLFSDEWLILGYGVNSKATLNLGGSAEVNSLVLYIGYEYLSNGKVNMTGGTLYVSSLRLDPVSGNGNLNLHDGILKTKSISINNNGKIDIRRGTMVIDGNCCANIEQWKQNGWITAYADSNGVSDSRATLHCEFRASENKTYLWATVSCTIADLPGDLNGDCRVDVNDLAILANYWMASVFD